MSRVVSNQTAVNLTLTDIEEIILLQAAIVNTISTTNYKKEKCRKLLDTRSRSA